MGLVCVITLDLEGVPQRPTWDAWGDDSKLWLWKVFSRASTSYCKKLIWSEVMNYSIQNHQILILFKCRCVFKDPWFKALLSLLFNLLIKADLVSSLRSIYWHLKPIDLLVYDCPNFTGSSKAKELRRWKSSLPNTPFLTGHLCALETHFQC